MEHSTHGHSLSHAPGHSPGSRRPSMQNAASSSASQDTSPGQRSLQAHRLNIRHSKFFGSAVPPRRTSPVLGLHSTSIDSRISPPNKENAAPSAIAQVQDLIARRSSPIGILQEVHNSSFRRRAGARLPPGPIFEDEWSTDRRRSLSEANSGYFENSNESTPATMRSQPPSVLKETSLNVRRTHGTDSSPSRKARSSNCLMTNLEDKGNPEEYIEHLESQLASAMARIDTLTSPKTTNMRSVKLRALTVENRSLKAENAGWTRKTEDLLEEERWQHRAVETEMRNKIQELKENLEGKDARIMELEWDMECMQTRMKESDGLFEANAKLEKRIDVLSGMITGSPTRLRGSTTATSPGRMDPPRLTPRPMSMLTRVAPSPAAFQRSNTSASDSRVWDSRTPSSSTVVRTSPHIGPINSDNDAEALSDPDQWNDSPPGLSELNQQVPLDLMSHDSETFCSARSTSSRPASLLSTSSAGAVAWNFPSQPRNDTAEVSRRRMRRFPSGSVSLKPLILPSATVVSSLSSPAHVYPSIDSVTSREVSGSSSEADASYLTRLVDSQIDDTPTAGHRQRSRFDAQQQALRALEGRGDMTGTTNERLSVRSSPTKRRNRATQRSEARAGAGELQARRMTLQDELDGLPISPGESEGLSPTWEVSEQHPFPARHCDDEDSTTTLRSWRSVRSTALASPQRTRARQDTMSPGKKAQEWHETSARPRAHSSPDSVKADDNLVSRFTRMVLRTKQTPSGLARRIVSNAWALGSSSLGGVTWWLIGQQSLAH